MRFRLGYFSVRLRPSYLGPERSLDNYMRWSSDYYQGLPSLEEGGVSKVCLGYLPTEQGLQRVR